MSGAVLTATAIEPRRLDELARIVNREHGAVFSSARKTIEHAMACGDALLEARETVPRGQFQRWLAENIPANHTICFAYMRLARNREQVLAAQMTTVDAAVRFLAEKGLTQRTNFDAEDMEKVQQFAATHTREETAETFGVSVRTLADWKRTGWQPPRPRRTPTPTTQRRISIDDQMIERLAAWLVQRLAKGRDIPVDDRVRHLAEEALQVALGIHEGS